ncbi:Ig-like domain-containing protein [Aliagarivorans marinus]|uniref:Ig-like domain-containing protein n=1 Tax=Aliagarivorans marinus TaxID=561965 RepID=UPI0003F71B70|nr:di-heme oxidoredictase family protein [Aliagarivorans marinus]
MKRNHTTPWRRHTLACALAFSASTVWAGQGIEVGSSATLYFDDEGWTGGWSYLCLDYNCTAGELVNGRWQRDVTGLVSAGSDYLIQLKIQDNATGQYISPEYTVTAGDGGTTPPPNQAPSLSLTPPSGSLFEGDSYTLQANASDSDGEVVSVDFYLSLPGAGEQLYSSLSQAPYQATVQDAAAGNHSWRVVATDDGDLSTEQTAVVNVAEVPTGNLPPQVSISLPDGEFVIGDSITVAASASDSDGSIASVALTISEPEGGQIDAGSLTAAPYQWQVALTQAGTYSFNVVATDDQGDSRQQQAELVVADDSEPPQGDYGAEVIDNSTALYWATNQPDWPGGDYYMCKDDDADCYRAELVGGRWQAQQNNMRVGQTYNAVLKIPGYGTDAFPRWEVYWEGDGSTPGGGGPGGAGSKDPQVVAPSTPEILPAWDVGFDASVGNFLVAGIGAGAEYFGYTLYTFAADSEGVSNCIDCATWPALKVEDPAALVDSSRLSGSLGTITLPDGSLQVTYNGMPLYLRAADSEPGQLDGVSESWPLVALNLAPVPQELYQRALLTPLSMSAPNNGFAFNIDGNQVSWEFGATLGAVSGSAVSMFCTLDQVSFYETDLSSGSAAIPEVCTTASRYWYFFRYEMTNPGAGKYVIDNNDDFDPASAYRYTALFINDGQRIDLSTREVYTDTGANWMRFRHPRAYDGVTEAIRDATHNSSRVADLARYSIDAIETTEADGSITLTLDLNMPISYTGTEQGLVRLEGLQNGAGDAKLPTWVYNFEPSNNQTTYTQGGWSYGQNVSFEMTGVVGLITAQTYNTFQYYTIGQGFHSPIGDPRLSLVPKGGTHMVFNIKNYGGEFKNGHIGAGIHDMIIEKGGLFTQHLTTLHDPSEVDDFLWGHHLFHGVKLQKSSNEEPGQENLGSNPGDTGIGNELPEVKEGGPVACGDCHYRDGRGSEVINTPNGPRIAPPTYGVGLLQYIDGREAGFTWTGDVPTVRQQIKNALVNDHGIDPNDEAQISAANLELISKYTEYLTVPARYPSSYDDPAVGEGEQLFHDIGCTNCHQPLQVTSEHAPEAFRDLVIRPYTDMKLHQVAGGTYRTAPLWGLGRNIDLLENNNKLVSGQIDIGIALYDGDDAEQMAIHHMRERPLLFLHDGRASSLSEAIQMHDDEGSEADAVNAVAGFNGLSPEQQQSLIQFLRSL